MIQISWITEEMAHSGEEGHGLSAAAVRAELSRRNIGRRAAHRTKTRTVRLLRWLLPSCALGLAVLLVIWPSRHLIELPDVISITGLEQPTSERSTMTNVRFLGTDHNGLPFTISAGTAWHDSGRSAMVFLEDVSGSIVVGTGQWTSIRADSGFFDQTRQLLTLESAVTVSTSDGYRIESERTIIDLERGMAESDTLVEGTGPDGALEAQGFQITDNGGKFTFFGRLHLSIDVVPDHDGS